MFDIISMKSKTLPKIVIYYCYIFFWGLLNDVKFYCLKSLFQEGFELLDFEMKVT